MSIETESITLSMKSQIDGIRARHGHSTSSHAFASLYIWQEDMGLSLHLQADLFAAKCARRGKNTWFFPCGGAADLRAFIERLQEERELCLCYLREEDAAFLEREFAGRFQITERESDHEYLYDREGQQALTGNRFVRLRNDLHRIERQHALDWEPLCAENAGEALAISRAWQRQSVGSGGLEDRAAAERLLREWDALDVRGVVVSVDGEPYAVAAGYPLSPDCFDFSILKEKERLSGLSVYARHALTCALPKEFSRINAEEDLGIDGLRRMKQLMRPVEKNKLYEGRLRKDETAG